LRIGCGLWWGDGVMVAKFDHIRAARRIGWVFRGMPTGFIINSFFTFIELYSPLSTFIGLDLGETVTLQEMGIRDCGLRIADSIGVGGRHGRGGRCGRSGRQGLDRVDARNSAIWLD
jgi:hypothetical protein